MSKKAPKPTVDKASIVRRFQAALKKIPAGDPYKGGASK